VPVSEANVRKVRPRSNGAAQAAVPSWIAVIELMAPDSRVYALWNDAEQPLSLTVRDSLATYEVRSVPRTQRDEVREDLAA